MKQIINASIIIFGFLSFCFSIFFTSCEPIHHSKIRTNKIKVYRIEYGRSIPINDSPIGDIIYMSDGRIKYKSEYSNGDTVIVSGTYVIVLPDQQ